MQQAHRLIALHVGELVRVVMRQQEHAVLLPLEGFLRPFLARPNSRETAAFDDVDDLVESKLDRRQSLTGRNLRHSRRSDAFLTDELNERGVTLARVPPAELQCAQVLDVITAVDGNSL